MFGLLKGSSCKLQPAEREAWLGHLCGLCLALGNNYGQVTRLFANYDAALLSALCEAQNPSPLATRTSYCPLRRNFRMHVVAPDTQAAQYASSITLVMATTRIEDHLTDGETFLCRMPGLVSRITSWWMKKTRDAASEQGFDVGAIVDQARRQVYVEAQPGRDFYFYAQPTELAIGAAFRHTAYLAERPHNADILFEMGRMFGRVMYLLDSYLDLAADLLANRFNPLATCFFEVDRHQKVREIFQQACIRLRYWFDQLDLAQPMLAGKLLNYHVRERGQQVLAMCAGGAGDGRLTARNQPVQLPARIGHRLDYEDKPEPDDYEPQQPGCWTDSWYWPYCEATGCCIDTGCGDGDCGDGDCGNLDCGNLDCGDLDCGDCGNADFGDCGGADCGGADCSGADCGGVDCN